MAGWPTNITGVLASVATKYGGDVMQTLNSLLGNVDVGAIDAGWKPLINTDTRFRTGRFRFRDEQSPTPFEIAWLVSNQAGARNITVPVLSSGLNTLSFDELTARLYNKTIDAADNNTFANIPVASLTGNLLKTNLPAATVYTDQANTYGNYIQKFALNYLYIANSGNNQWAKLGFLGTLTHVYDILGIDADAYVLAVAKANIANGDMFYYSNGKLLRLGIGTTGQIIKVSGGVPSWGDEISASTLPSRNYFATDYANSSTLGTNRYQSISGDSVTDTTLANRTITLSNDIRVTRVYARVITNSLNGNGLAMGIMDDGVMVASCTAAAASTGLKDSGALDVTIAAGSQIALVLSTTTASSGSYEVRPLVIEYEIGAPGAFGGTIVKEIGVQVGTLPRSLNFDVGTDFVITEDAPNNEIEIHIANDAITAAHIGAGQVGNSELANDAVDAAKIATNAVTASEINADAVTTAKILARNVTEAKIELPLLNNIVKIPCRRNAGIINGNVATPKGFGLLDTPTQEGTATPYCSNSPQKGSGVQYSTGTVSNTRRGERSPNTVILGIKNPAIFGRVSLYSTGGTVADDCRFFCGIGQDAQIADNLNPLDAKTGIGLQVQANGSEAKICHNDGNASDDNDLTGFTPTNDLVFSFYIYKVEGSSQYNWYIWAGTTYGDINQTPSYSGTVTTKIPTATTGLYFHCTLINKNSRNCLLNRDYVAASMDMM